jgi:hypothetical protein
MMILTLKVGQFLEFSVPAGGWVEFEMQGYGQTVADSSIPNCRVLGKYHCTENKTFYAWNASPFPMEIRLGNEVVLL